MEIKPTYVTFEQAKLLKEKNYEIDTEEVLFCIDEVNNIEEHQIKNREVIYDGGLLHSLDENEYRVYHQWQVCEWLRVNHGIWVSVAIFVKRDETVVWVYDIYKNNYIIEQFQRSKGFNSPQEAYSAAFDYILKEMV
jgi:hypothetical protein